MTREEREVVDEFVQAVTERDPHLTEACLAFTPASQLAVWCAQLLAEARVEGSRKVNRGLWVELERTRARVKELRALLDRGAGRRTA